MQKVIIQEQVTIWQDVCLSFPDDIDISTKEKLVEAMWWEEEGYNSYDEWLNAQSEDC